MSGLFKKRHSASKGKIVVYVPENQELDEVVDRAYKPNGFRDDNERLALLLDMYSKKVKENESTN